MAKETGTEDQLPEKHRWNDLENLAAPDRLEFYKILLIHLGGHGTKLVGAGNFRQHQQFHQETRHTIHAGE